MTRITDENMLGLHQRSGHKMKQRWHDIHGPGDMPPSLLLFLQNGRCFAGAPGDLLEQALAAGVTMGEAIKVGAGLLCSRSESPPRLLCFAHEAYYREAAADSPAMEEVRQIQRGDMKEDFMTNPNSSVSESVVTHLALWTGDDIEMGTVVEPFHYDDGGQLIFGEPLVRAEGATNEGDLVDNIRDLFKVLHDG